MGVTIATPRIPRMSSDGTSIPLLTLYFNCTKIEIQKS